MLISRWEKQSASRVEALKHLLHFFNFDFLTTQLVNVYHQRQPSDICVFSDDKAISIINPTFLFLLLSDFVLYLNISFFFNFLIVNDPLESLDVRQLRKTQTFDKFQFCTQKPSVRIAIDINYEYALPHNIYIYTHTLCTYIQLHVALANYTMYYRYRYIMCVCHVTYVV